MKHTPGPWKADENGIITGGEHFCTSIACTPFIKAGPPNYKEVLANTKLIAAAPDLLEALGSLVKRGNESQIGGFKKTLGWSFGLTQDLEKAEAAITLATPKNTTQNP